MNENICIKIFKIDEKYYRSNLQENEIFAVDSNATGRFLVSADKSSLINIWDRAIET